MLDDPRVNFAIPPRNQRRRTTSASRPTTRRSWRIARASRRPLRHHRSKGASCCYARATNTGPSIRKASPGNRSIRRLGADVRRGHSRPSAAAKAAAAQNDVLFLARQRAGVSPSLTYHASLAVYRPKRGQPSCRQGPPIALALLGKTAFRLRLRRRTGTNRPQRRAEADSCSRCATTPPSNLPGMAGPADHGNWASAPAACRPRTREAQGVPVASPAQRAHQPASGSADRQADRLVLQKS